MNPISIVLKMLAPIFILVGLLHLILGPGAEILLGAVIPHEVLSDPVLDSQNRFYGVVFGLYGVLLYLCSTNLQKYLSVLRCVLLFFFFGGLARVVSIYAVGMPSYPVMILLLSEILLPIVLLYLIRRT